MGSEQIRASVSAATYISTRTLGPYDVVSSCLVRLGMDQPAEVESTTAVGLAVAKDLGSGPAFRLVARYGDDAFDQTMNYVPDIFLRFDDVYPTISTATYARIQLFAESVGADLVDRLGTNLQTVLEQVGHAD